MGGLVVINLVCAAYYQNKSLNTLLLSSPPANALYKQANQPISARGADLLQRMSPEEKLGQMALSNPPNIWSRC